MTELPSDINSVTTVAVDLTKHVFQVHGWNAAGRLIVVKTLRRKDILPFFGSTGSCLIGMEARGCAHYWGRQLQALGHDVKLIPSIYVKEFGKQLENDSAAIYEALRRPHIRYVKVRNIDKQAVLVEHEVREMLVGQRTQLLDALRELLAEIGVIAAQGTGNIRTLVSLIHDGYGDIPDAVRQRLMPLTTQIEHLDSAIRSIAVLPYSPKPVPYQVAA